MWLLPDEFVVGVASALKFLIKSCNFEGVCQFLEMVISALLGPAGLDSLIFLTARPLTVTCSLHFSPEIEVDDVFVHRHVFCSRSGELLGRCLLDESLLYLNLLCDLVVSVILSRNSIFFA